jgi:predicted nucleotidyltransferase
MEHDALIRAASGRLAAAAGIEALFLAGSHGAGTADVWSDIDVLAVASPARHDAIAAVWRRALGELAGVVYWNDTRDGDARLLNAITEAWLRLDLSIVPRDDFARRSRAGLWPLHDPAELHATLPGLRLTAGPDPARVQRTVDEFLRVLGLMTVGLGRREHVALVKGVAHLRDLFTDLMFEEYAILERGGAYSLGRRLPPADLETLAGLPYPPPERDALIEAHLALARAFLPRARKLFVSLSLDWPAAFEIATRRHLRRELGVDLPLEPPAPAAAHPRRPALSAR